VHERALMRDLLNRVDAVARAEGASRVTRVGVQVGPLSHFTPEHFREHFADASRGTIADGASVDVSSDGTGTDVLLESVELELP
jgi:hydrogenase nickel incorporation protein HypA/HybF